MKTKIIPIGLLGLVLSGLLSTYASNIQARLELDRRVLPADTQNIAVVKITLDAAKVPEEANRPPVNLSIVLDKSGSMAGEKIHRAREAAMEAVRRLGQSDLFSLVNYDHQVHTLIPAQQVRQIDGLEQKIRQIRTGGNTALFGGVSQGANEIRKAINQKKYVHRIILLSDGLANVGPQSPAELGRLGTSLIKEGISVTSVGIGNNYNEDLMTRLSAKSDGNAYFAESAVDLPHILSAELGDVLNVVARKVVITIECPEGVRPKRIIGREGRVTSNTVEIGLNQLYGGQEKYALVEVEIDPRANNEEIEIAKATVQYEDAMTAKPTRAHALCPAKFSDDKELIAANCNIAVQTEVVRNTAAYNRDLAITNAENGNTIEAVKILQENEQMLMDWGNTHKNGEFIADAEEQNLQWNYLQTKGLTKENRKRLRTDSYNDRYQQSSKSKLFRK